MKLEIKLKDVSETAFLILQGHALGKSKAMRKVQWTVHFSLSK